MRPALPLVAALLAAVAACSPKPEDTVAAEPARTAPVGQDERCLLEVWAGQAERDIAFDRAHDRVEGGSIACATHTSASRYARAIGELRTAAEAGDSAALVELAGLPLTYIDAAGARREFTSRDALAESADAVFDPEVRTAISAMSVDRLAVADGGGSFRLGGLWLVPPEAGATPRLVTINRQALRESAAVSRPAG